MALLQSLKARIRSIESTQKVTKAMKMIAASCLRKTHLKTALIDDSIIEFKKVFDTLYDERPKELCDTINNFYRGNDSYLQNNRKKVRLFVVFTSDRGLCGHFNISVIKAMLTKLQGDGSSNGGSVVEGAYTNANNADKDQVENVLICIGKRGYEALKNLPVTEISFCDDLVLKINNFSFDLIDSIEANIIALSAKYDVIECFAVYNAFISVLQYSTIFDKLWPIAPKEDLFMRLAKDQTTTLPIGINSYEPHLTAVLSYLRDNYLKMKICNISLSSMLSEYSTRMTAMESASKNSQELTMKLTKKLNRIRQENITNELVEIIAGVQYV